MRLWHIIIHVFVLSSLFSVQGTVCAQEKAGAGELAFTLESVIRQAQDSSVSASLSRELAMKDYWGYCRYLAGTGPQVIFNMNPSYSKQSHYVDYNYMYPTILNRLSSDAGISYSQQLTSLGGYLYADTRFIFSEVFNAGKDSSLFGFTPVRVGYRQELIGWNGLSWQKRIQESEYRTSVRRLTYRLLQVAEQAANLYFDYVACYERFNIYDQNYRSADTLFRIGERKLPLTTITVAELRSLELERKNASTQLEQARAMLKNARRELLSFLKMKDEGQLITITMPDIPPPLSIDAEEAVERAAKNNPEILASDDKSLRAEYELDRARHQKGLQAGLDVSIGLQNYATTGFSKYYGTPELYSFARVTLSVPIYDGGQARRREKEAESAYKSAVISGQEERRQLEQSVMSLLSLLESRQLTMTNAAEGVRLADETFALIGGMYAEGLLDINSYQLALNRKDSAHQLYTSTVCSFWENYYKLSRLTMYDFINDIAL